MTPNQQSWLTLVTQEAKDGGHVWPEMAACEAALESGFGSSALAREALNLFGMKQHRHPVYGDLVLPTKEFLGGEWTVVSADWVKYDKLSECFEDRMATLTRLAPQPGFEHYAAALAAKDAVNYVTQVSASWSTDPQRASKVVEIYNAMIAAQGDSAWPNS